MHFDLIFRFPIYLVKCFTMLASGGEVFCNFRCSVAISLQPDVCPDPAQCLTYRRGHILNIVRRNQSIPPRVNQFHPFRLIPQ